MTETFTPGLDLTVKPTAEEQKIPLADFAEPSENVIKNILNFSKNLEIRPSRLIREIELIKS